MQVTVVRLTEGSLESHLLRDWGGCMRLMVSSSILALFLASSALADIDPHIIYATGGDATPIGANGISVDLSNGGGGIFVFQNTLGDLSNLDVKVQFPFAFFPNGFTLADT